ncbi:MAG: transglutaminase domain-containing protein [Chloroflexi bacterium]|nr:transglutaminase domain-containing protein [Chloroflexota bacterium]
MLSASRRRPTEGWLTVGLLASMVWAVAHAIEEGAWSDHLDVLVPLALGGLGVGLVAAKSGLRPWAAHLASLLLLLESIVLIHANRMSPGRWEGRLAELSEHVSVWFQTAFGGGNSRDNVMFAIAMASLCWALGYGASWLVFRYGLGWAALAVNSAVLLLYLSYSYASLNYHFYIQLFAGLLLVARLELARREGFWRRFGHTVQPGLGGRVVLASAATVLLILNLAGRGPINRPADALEPAWARISDAWQRGQGNLDRLFGGVQGPAVVVVGLAFQGTMQPREGFELGTEPILKIAAPRSRYWRTTTYEVYTGQGMVAGDINSERIEADQPIPLPFGAGEAREEMEQTVTILAPQSNLVFAAEAPVRVDVPTLFEWRGTQDDPANLRLTNLIRRGQQYTVVSATSLATEVQLRTAGIEYPPGVERYLQLPDTLPGRVRQATAELTAGLATPYDQAALIERFLRSLPYETRVAPPPSDRDWVDYTLFDLEGGYSDYYSTAMAVMLRTLGVPARVVSGFAPGELDEAEGAFIAYESDAHSWVEVFFPRYGWITFEPSSLRALPFRPFDENALANADGLGAGGPFDGDMEPFFDDLFGDGGDYVPSLAPRRDLAWIVAFGVLAAIAALTGLAYVLVLRLFRRGLAGLPWHAQWYAQLRRLARWGGLGGQPSQTPYEYTSWLGRRFPGTEPMVRPIAECYVEGAYGGREPGPETLARASAAWERARRPLARRVLLRGIIAAQERATTAWHTVKSNATRR